MKKKAIKLATSTAIAASAFVAAAPANQADAAVNVDQLVQDAQNAGTVLKWAISVEGSADYETRPYAAYNAAKKAIEGAQNALKGASTSDKLKYEARLTDPQIQVKRAAAYIDAITSSEKIKELTANLVAAEKSGDLDKVEAAYHKATAEYRKQSALLDRVYGQSTRDGIRNLVKPALEKAVAGLKNEVTVHMLANAAAADSKAGKVEDAAKKLTEAQAILDANVLKWETSLQKSVNDVADAMPLQVLSIASDNKNTITVKFSKEVPTVLPAGQFVFDNGLKVQSAVVASDKKTVTLTTTNQEAGKTYTLVSYQGTAVGKAFTTPSTVDNSGVSVDSADRARLEVSQTRTYTVTLKNADGSAYVGTANIRLFNHADRTGVPTNGTISSVNGSTTGINAANVVETHTFGAGKAWSGSTSADGKITFTVTSAAGEALIVPVIEKDLNSDGTATFTKDTFVTAGATTFYTLATTGFKAAATLASTDFVDKTNDYVAVGTVKHKWDTNDKFFIQGVPVSQDAFEAAFSTGDTFTVDYNADKDNVSSWNITSNVTVDADLKVTSPASVVSYDGVNYLVTGTGQPGNRVELYKDPSAVGTVGTFDSTDVFVGATTVAADGTWSISAQNLSQGSVNNYLAVQFASNLSAATSGLLTQTTAHAAVESVPAIYEGPFAANTLVHAEGASGVAGTLDRGDTLVFTFTNAKPGTGFVTDATGTVTVQDNLGKLATLSVKATNATTLEITAITAPTDFNFIPTASALFYEVTAVSGLKNEDNLTFNLADSVDKNFGAGK